MTRRRVSDALGCTDPLTFRPLHEEPSDSHWHAVTGTQSFSMVSAIQILKPLASGISCVVDRRARSAVVRAQQASTHALPRRDCLALVGLLASGVACQPAVAYSELDSFLPDERIPSTLPKGAHPWSPPAIELHGWHPASALRCACFHVPQKLTA